MLDTRAGPRPHLSRRSGYIQIEAKSLFADRYAVLCHGSTTVCSRLYVTTPSSCISPLARAGYVGARAGEQNESSEIVVELSVFSYFTGRKNESAAVGLEIGILILVMPPIIFFAFQCRFTDNGIRGEKHAPIVVLPHAVKAWRAWLYPEPKGLVIGFLAIWKFQQVDIFLPVRCWEC